MRQVTTIQNWTFLKIIRTILGLPILLDLVLLSMFNAVTALVPKLRLTISQDLSMRVRLAMKDIINLSMRHRSRL